MSALTKPFVRIAARVIPTGIVQTNDEYYATATISLLPVAIDQADPSCWPSSPDSEIGASQTTCIPLDQWPARIAELTAQGGITVNISPISNSGDQLPTPGCPSGKVIFTRHPPQAQSWDGEKINRLWTDLMAVDDWTLLTDALMDSQQGRPLDAIKQDDTPLPPSDVLPFGRSDAASIYALERAKEVLIAMQGKSNTCKIGACHVNTRGLSLDPTRFTFEQKPWIGLHEPVTRLAQAATNVTDAALPAPIYSQADLLAQERIAQETALRARLADKSKATQRLHQVRADFLTASTLSGKIDALKKHAAERATSLSPSGCVAACTPSAAGGTAEQIKDQAKAAHSLGTMPDLDEFGDPVFDPFANDIDERVRARRAAAQRLNFIQSTPSLARLFNLVIDVRVELDKVSAHIDLPEAGVDDSDSLDHFAEPGSGSLPAPGQKLAYYMFLSACIGAKIDNSPPRLNRPIWSLAKFRRPGRPLNSPDVGHFWLCTMEELLLRLASSNADLRASSSVFQFDGVVDLGVAARDGTGARNPRYDIASLDSIASVESDMHFDRRVAVSQRTNGESLAGDSTFGAHTRRSAGLALLDRWRQDQAVSQIATARQQMTTAKPPAIGGAAGEDANSDQIVVLDAEQLTMGYRLDVGVKVDENRRQWRSLMHRVIAFKDPKGGVPVDDIIDEYYEIDRANLNRQKSHPNTHARTRKLLEKRVRADGAMIALVSRLKNNRATEAGTAPRTAIVEETMATWQGDPLGIECIEFDEGQKENCGTAVGTKDGFEIDSSVIDLDITYSLATKQEAYLPPRLRYGWSYHFGLRPVYAGGVVLPLENAIARYERVFGTGLSLPACDETSLGRRFLRHERIEAPMLAVSVSELRKFDEARKKNIKSVGSPGFILLREKDASAFRLLIPPAISLQDAALHGALDQLQTIAFEDKARNLTFVRPRDGLREIDYGRSSDGFPKAQPQSDDQESAPAIFRYASDPKQPRTKPYYPDPAATTWVIRARRTGSIDDYLDGQVTLDIRPAGMNYPDVAPLALDAVAAASPRLKPAKSIHDLFQKSALAVLSKRGELQKSGGGVKVQHATFAFTPGEDFEFDVWCAPSGTTLMDKFDVVESMALLVARDGGELELTNGTIDQVCRESLLRNLPQSASHLKDVRSHSVNAYCGVGGELLPAPELVEAIAKTLADAMHSRPIPELAAVTRIRAAHAIIRPIEPPAFVPRDDLPKGVRVVRVEPATLNATIYAPPIDGVAVSEIVMQRAQLLRDQRSRWAELSDDGATGVLFDGEIDVDLLTTSDVELRASLVSPTSPAIDDPRLGRSSEDIAQGKWPKFRSSDRIWFDHAVDSMLDLDVTQRLFGFSVSADGRVRLPLQKTTLLALRDLPDVCIVDRATSLKRYDLFDEQVRAGKATPPKPSPQVGSDAIASAIATPRTIDPTERICRVERVAPFTDPIARQLHLQLVATSRFAGLFPHVTDDSPDAHALFSDPSRIWLPATRRPDRVSPRSLTPAFVWSKSPPRVEQIQKFEGVVKDSTVRDCVVRVRIKRPWFTSGEGERLGIVLWPPRLLSPDAASTFEKNLAQDLLPRIGSTDAHIAATDDFRDADLGPGGPFVTRWGADPIREGAEPEGWLMPPSAFTDYDPKRCDGPEFEEAVLMPIPRADNKTAAPGAEGQAPSTTAATADVSEDQREFMTISLLTYEPHFDPEYELWYVDIAINPKNVPEPFVRLGLVRFQKNARRQIQVSEPVVEWVQVLPRRTVSVSEEPIPQASGKSCHRKIVLTVESPADYGAVSVDSQCAPDTASRAPFMRAHVVRSTHKPDGSVFQSVVSPSGNASGSCVRISPSSVSCGTLWSGEIEFDETGEASSYALFVEEIQTFLPATYSADEPVERGRSTGATETGPRFAAWLELGPPPIEAKQPGSTPLHKVKPHHQT